MKNFRKQKKEQKVRKNAQFFDFSKIFLLYEAEKKISKKSSFFDEKLKINHEAAEKALNNKEALGMKASFNRMNLKTYSNNSIVFDDLRVNCLRQRIDSYEKPECNNRPFNRKCNTKNIFCVKKIKNKTF